MSEVEHVLEDEAIFLFDSHASFFDIFTQFDSFFCGFFGDDFSFFLSSIDGGLCFFIDFFEQFGQFVQIAIFLEVVNFGEGVEEFLLLRILHVLHLHIVLLTVALRGIGWLRGRKDICIVLAAAVVGEDVLIVLRVIGEDVRLPILIAGEDVLAATLVVIIRGILVIVLGAAKDVI